MSPSDDIKLRINILDATFFITQLELEPSLHLAHSNILAMKRKAYYPVTHTHVKIFSVSSVAQEIFIGNAFLRPIPERIFAALV